MRGRDGDINDILPSLYRMRVLHFQQRKFCGLVVEYRTCTSEVAGSILSRSTARNPKLLAYYVLMPTQPPTLGGTVTRNDAACRISALLDALCARQPRYACFLWTAARNLVRDVIGHVTSIDLQPPIKDAEDVTELDDVGGRHRRRAAVEMELFHGNDTYLACKSTNSIIRFIDD